MKATLILLAFLKLGSRYLPNRLIQQEEPSCPVSRKYLLTQIAGSFFPLPLGWFPQTSTHAL